MSILGLFNTVNSDIVAENVTIDLSEFGGVQPSTESIHEIHMESAIDLCNLSAATHVADIMVLEASIMDEDKASVMMENVVTDMLKKLKDTIVKLWKKVKAWFLKMIENVKVFFSSGDKFIKEYESALNSKNLKDFEVNTYPFEDGESKVKRMIDKCESEKTAASSALESAGKEDTAIEDSVFEDKKEALFKGLDVNSESDFSEKIEEHYGMKDGKEDIKDFGKGLSKSEMIKAVKAGKEQVSKLTQASKDADNTFKTLLGKLDRYSGKEDTPPVAAGNIKKWSSYITTVQGYVNKLYSKMIDCEKTKYSESLSVLKKYMYYRGSKEDKLKAAGIHESGAVGIFESFSM